MSLFQKADLDWIQRYDQSPAMEEKKLRALLRAALSEYVNEMSCKYCGSKNQQHSINLHHPGLDGHLGNVHDLVRSCATIEEIEAEIARCEPLCGGCHAREHIRINIECRSGKLMGERQIITWHHKAREVTVSRLAHYGKRSIPNQGEKLADGKTQSAPNKN